MHRGREVQARYMSSIALIFVETKQRILCLMVDTIVKFLSTAKSSQNNVESSHVWLKNEKYVFLKYTYRKRSDINVHSHIIAKCESKANDKFKTENIRKTNRTKKSTNYQFFTDFLNNVFFIL